MTFAIILGLAGGFNARPVQAQNVSASSADLSTVSPDECGLFVWVGHNEAFRFLAKNAGAIVLRESGEAEALRPVSRIKIDKFDMAWQQTLRDKRGAEYVLRLQNPLSTPDSILYRQGTLSFPSADGWLRIESVVGMSTCNASQTISNIGSVQSASAFSLPAWLTKPDFKGTEIQAVETPSKVVISAPVNEGVFDRPAYSPPSSTYVETRPAPIAPPVTIIEPPEITDSIIPASYVTVSSAPTPVQAPILPAPVQVPVQLDEVWIDPDLSVEFADVSEPIAAPDIVPAAALTSFEVQLGAYKDPVQGLQAWDELSARMPYLADHNFRIATAEIAAKGTMYRLRLTGFEKYSTANQFCERLKADSVDCYAAKAN